MKATSFVRGRAAGRRKIAHAQRPLPAGRRAPLTAALPVTSRSSVAADRRRSARCSAGASPRTDRRPRVAAHPDRRDDIKTLEAVLDARASERRRQARAADARQRAGQPVRDRHRPHARLPTSKATACSSTSTCR